MIFFKMKITKIKRKNNTNEGIFRVMFKLRMYIYIYD